MKKLLATTAMVLMLSGVPALAEDGDKAPPADGHGGHHMMEKMEKWKERQEALYSKLPDDKAASAKKLKEELRATRKENREQCKALREEAKALLTAETFDKSAYLAKMAEIQAKHAANYKARDEKIAELATQMNAEERKVLADLFASHKMKMRHKGKMSGMMDGDDEDKGEVVPPSNDDDRDEE
ncbi:MAG: periplasmic heavy metal sensor [Alphaproteobacteria bacterium]|nr:periplasmic heavy metal sensor [Alphaproteobacteria bacterium]